MDTGVVAMAEQQRHERHERWKRQLRIEHAIQANSDAGVCSLTLQRLKERFSDTDTRTIQRTANEMGIKIPATDEVYLTRQELNGVATYASLPGGLPRCRTWQQAKFHSNVGAKKADARISGDEAWSRIPDGGARETMRARMQPHPLMEEA